MARRRTASGAKRGRVGALLLAPIAAAVLFTVTAIATAAGGAPGSFSATGSMTITRFGAAAAPLAHGRVLVAGVKRRPLRPAERRLFSLCKKGFKLKKVKGKKKCVKRMKRR